MRLGGEATSSRKRLALRCARGGGRRRLLPGQPRQLASIDLQELLEDLAKTLGAWTYLLVGCFAFAETGAFVGLVVPGETVMLSAARSPARARSTSTC